MVMTHCCCCSVIVWCYVFLFFDGIAGLLFAVKHFDLNWFDLKERAQGAHWDVMGGGKCMDLGLGSIGIAIEMSLLVIVAIAFVGLCLRKSLLLLPYLIFKLLIVGLTIYMLVQYSLHYDQCKTLLFASIVALLFSLMTYSVVLNAFRVIKYQYHEVTGGRYP
ncbi:unnamed protein product, partial [Mesorhabditis spiculigera]